MMNNNVDGGRNTRLEPYQLYMADVPYDDGDGYKYRPALILLPETKKTQIFKVTTQYADKSAEIQDVYYPIVNWEKAGLKYPSYIDVHMAYTVTTKRLTQKKFKGTLPPVDVAGLFKFINEHQDAIRLVNNNRPSKRK